jgi:hypothetical protein
MYIDERPGCKCLRVDSYPTNKEYLTVYECSCDPKISRKSPSKIKKLLKRPKHDSREHENKNRKYMERYNYNHPCNNVSQIVVKEYDLPNRRVRGILSKFKKKCF